MKIINLGGKLGSFTFVFKKEAVNLHIKKKCLKPY